MNDDQAGRRVDNFVNSILGGVPRARLYQMVRRGEIRVDGSRVKPDYKLRSGESVRIPPFTQDRTAPQSGARPGASLVRRLASAILYEDDDLLIIDKPAGLAAHAGTGIETGLIEAMRALRPGQSLELAHRLDRATSGCIALARSMTSLRALQLAQREGRVDKRYIALVVGQWPAQVRRIDSRLAPIRVAGGERRMQSAGDGRDATTFVSVRRRLDTATLLDIELGTGRMHQIRVHTAEAGHAVAGDEKYGRREDNARFRRHGLKRLFLHATGLVIRLPGRTVSVQASMPAELQAVLDAFARPSGD
ncbi:MAG: RluA family pseudouridine synthase [Gammaproteobacteria bacterium]